MYHELLRQPEIEPLNNAPIALLLDVALIRIIKIATNSETMIDTLEKLELISLLSLLHNLPCPGSLLRWESMVILGARKQQRFG
jgi:hypothetical protein